MREFLIALQFLTRLRLVKQTEWTAEGFGKSVQYFPLAGGVVGLILAAFAYLAGPQAADFHLPPHAAAALTLALGVLLTGGLTLDGYMDTADGVFSGRPRDRMLEIMKDSRVGANGVTAFGLLLLLKWSLLMDIPAAAWPLALFVAPVAGKLAMVAGVTLFPYARPEGIGKAFAQYAGPRSLAVAALFTAALLLPCGESAWLAAGAAALVGLLLARYITSVLGGLTGDVYGALAELGEIAALLVFLF